jgi:hypothetical protein
MRLISRRSRALIVAGACGLLIGAGACGDDQNINADAMVNPDGDTPDGEQPDAPPNPNELRSGTIAILDTAVTNPGATYSGATVSITYTDLTAGDVPPAYGQADPAPGQCSVKIYNVGTDEPPPSVDEGDVTITGGLSPIGTCSYDEAAKDYRCPAGSGTVPEGSIAGPGGNGTMTVTFLSGTPFAEVDAAGMYVTLVGFTNPAYNGTFPVVNVPADNILVVANPAAAGQTPESVPADATPGYALWAGAGPTPINRDFLGDDSTTLTVGKVEGQVVTSFTGDIIPSGEGLQLADTSALVHELPGTAQDVRFTCDEAANGVCGPGGGLIYGFVVSGETTDADLTGTLPVQMPAATTRYATFLCIGTPGQNEIVIPQGAMDVILSTGPTRIRTQLMRITADQGKPQTSIIAGHALVGFTDLTQQ